MLYTLLELPGAFSIAACHLTHLTATLKKYSKGKYSKKKAMELNDAAKYSIGSTSPAQAFELQPIIRTILFLEAEIKLLDLQIKQLVK